MWKRALFVNIIPIAFSVCSVWLLSNIIDFGTPLLIVTCMMFMCLFMMMFSNVWEIVNKRNAKFNILSILTAMDGLIMITSSLMMWNKTIQLTEAQNSILLYISIISMVSFFILGTICIRLEKDFKNLSNKFNNEEESEEM
ncbi:MAG: hypothetical protein IKK43_06555 [Clostridia bacterium]|nr:hypothetical protein [Clostridia bacterium]